MHHLHGGGGRQYQDATVRHRAACVMRLHAFARSAPVPPIHARRQMRWPAAIPERSRPPPGRLCATAWRSRASTAAAAKPYATADAFRVGTDNWRAQMLRSRVDGGGTAPLMRAHQRQWPSRQRGNASVLGGAPRRRQDGAVSVAVAAEAERRRRRPWRRALSFAARIGGGGTASTISGRRGGALRRRLGPVRAGGGMTRRAG